MTSNALRNREVVASIMNAKRAAQASKYAADKNAEGRIVSANVKGMYDSLGNLAKSTAGIAAAANSPEWYKVWPNIGQVIGDGKVPQYVPNDISYDQAAFMPSVISLIYDDTWGETADPQGNTYPEALLPINEAALRYQTNLYSYNSVLNTVAASDVMQYTIVGVDIVGLFCQVARALRCYRTFDVNTNELNRKLLEGVGWDYSDMELNYKQILNWLATEIESFNNDIFLPASITYLHRKAFLQSGAWAEDYGKNSAIYVTRPLSFHVWDEPTGKLTANRYPHYLTFAAVVSAYRLMKNSLLGSTDLVALARNVKSGALNGLELFVMPQFTDPDVPLPIYPVDEVLEQFMNAHVPFRLTGINTVAPMVLATNWWTNLPKAYHLNQNASGFLVPTMDVTGTAIEAYEPYSVTGSPATATSIDFKQEMFNFLHDEASVDDVLVATRLAPAVWNYYVVANGTGSVASISTPCPGTEVLLGLEMTANLSGTSITRQVINPGLITTPASYVDIINCFYSLRAVPALKYGFIAGGSGGISKITQDWHSMIELTEKTVRQLNRGAVLSEFYISAKSKTEFKSALKPDKSGDPRAKTNKRGGGHRRSGGKPQDKTDDKGSDKQSS